VVGLYALDDRRDFADATEGLSQGFPGPVLGDDGHVIFDGEWLSYFGDEEPAQAARAGTPTTDNALPWRRDG
jgi:hypothetical protein